RGRRLRGDREPRPARRRLPRARRAGASYPPPAVLRGAHPGPDRGRGRPLPDARVASDPQGAGAARRRARGHALTGAGLATATGAVELTLPVRPESVALARLALAGVAAIAGASAADAADLKLAVSEVCTSVVLALDDDADAEPFVIRYTCGDRALGFEV